MVRGEAVGLGLVAEVDQLVEAKLPAVDGGGLWLQGNQQLLRGLRRNQPSLEGRSVTGPKEGLQEAAQASRSKEPPGPGKSREGESPSLAPPRKL